MTPASLASTLEEMIHETKKGHVTWQMELQSTDELDDSVKHHVTEDGITWTIDECFTSYYCKFHGVEYRMITYEHIRRHDDQVRSENLIFLPPVGLRFFDVGILSPYIIDADAVLLDRFHQLWELLVQLIKTQDSHVSLKVFDPYE